MTSPDSFYRSFVEQIQISVRSATPDQEVQRLLDGAAADEVHTKIPRSIRSKDGIFFSGHSLAQETAELAKNIIIKGARVFDPACGAGDLLLAAARLLPIQNTIEKTLEKWGEILGGSDLHQTFVDATKWRLILLAKSRHGINIAIDNIDFENIFQGIRKLDYFAEPAVSKDYECILVNPPFGHRAAPDECKWSSGKTQLAGLFLDTIFQHRKEGQMVVAILPDVLRGGVRYERWREMIATKSRVTATKIYGRFEKRTDVDVFICRYECTSNVTTSTKEIHILDKQPEVGDFFSIKIGAVVPHRHSDQKGNLQPYLKVKNAPANSETIVSITRKFNGVCFQTPFIAIRRTSNPSDKQRIVCTIVSGPDLVAVENHLIVITPNSKKISDCHRLVKVLSSEVTTEHINSKIRCRHLTTGALKSIPLSNWEN